MDRWRLTRAERWLRVEVDPSALEAGDEDEIIRAVRGEADRADLDDIHLTGRVLTRPVLGTRALLRRIGNVARNRGVRFHIAPI